VVFPERRLHILARDTGDPRPDGKLSGREDLRLDTTNRTHRINQLGLWYGRE
jgi:hypothetical protein